MELDRPKDSDSKREIYSYEAPWDIYGLAWSRLQNNQNSFRLAISSFIEAYSNVVQVVKLDTDRRSFSVLGEFDHPYPATKVMWSPSSDSVGARDLLATSGDYLRIWNATQSAIDANKLVIKRESLLNNVQSLTNNHNLPQNRHTDYCAPLTSLDWNTQDLTLLATSSIDTTCIMWDLTKLAARVQIIAHDKEVYDLAWAPASGNVFGTVGGDGSLRVFDLRALEHSTILYETESQALMRLSWNIRDGNYVAVLPAASSPPSASSVLIVDIRQPSKIVTSLVGHSSYINAMAWAPSSASYLCSGGDDASVFIWEVGGSGQDPYLGYNAGGPVNNVQWEESHQEWIAIGFDKTLQVLRV